MKRNPQTPEQQAQTIANIQRRAETLFQDGYTYSESDYFPGVFYVHAPIKRTETTTTSTMYKVWCSDAEGHSCNCESWKHYGTCKHYIAVSYEVARIEAIGADMDRMSEEFEYGDSGCDPFAEY